MKLRIFGDVITHELGHLIGLDHSTMPFATMFYKLTRGQSTLSFDDLLGEKMLYTASLTHQGSIRGSIAGSHSVVGLFAVDVKLVSSKRGKVIASVLSEEDGSFEFKGVPLNDVYYIFISPFKALGSVSEYYQTGRSDFCTGHTSFRGGFYRSCGNSRKGHPLGVELTSNHSSVDVGTVSIQCDLDVPINYLSQRGVAPFELGLEQYGDSFIGYFSESDVEYSYNDEIKIDLRNFDSSSGDYYLDLKLISQDFFSRVVYKMDIESPFRSLSLAPTVGADNTPILNLSRRISLSESASDNLFIARISPVGFDEFLERSSFLSESLFFPDFKTFGDDKYFYQFVYYISRKVGADYQIYRHYRYPQPVGNERCMEGEEAYAVKGFGSITGGVDENNLDSTDKGILSCGSLASVRDERGRPSGGGDGCEWFFSFSLFREVA